MDLYKKYYLDDEQINKILKEGIIVFDTSALLDLYYYSHSSQEIIFDKVFGFLANRLWIPAQVYFEFLKNRTVVADKPISSYKNLIHKPKSGADGGHVEKMVELSNGFLKNVQPIKNQLKTLKEKTIREDKYPSIPSETYVEIEHAIEKFETDINGLIEQVKRFSGKINTVIEKQIEIITNEKKDDKVLETINAKFKIGKEYTYDEQLEISKEGVFRYSEQIPPGYEDADEKIGMQKYGDLFAWKQILTFAREEKKSVLFITNDVKEDWYDKDLNAPRYELLKEFADNCDQSFWTYNMKNFLYQMNKILEDEQEIFTQMIKETEEIEEVKNISDFSDYDYIEIINKFLSPEIIVDRELAISDEWRIFGQSKIFMGNSNIGKPVLVMLNFIKGSKYTSGLHPLKNIFEVKKYYDDNSVRYDYYQFTIASSKEVANNLYSNQFNKKNIKKLYNRKSVKCFVGYIENEDFKYIASNIES